MATLRNQTQPRHPNLPSCRDGVIAAAVTLLSAAALNWSLGFLHFRIVAATFEYLPPGMSIGVPIILGGSAALGSALAREGAWWPAKVAGVLVGQAGYLFVAVQCGISVYLDRLHWAFDESYGGTAPIALLYAGLLVFGTAVGGLLSSDRRNAVIKAALILVLIVTAVLLVYVPVVREEAALDFDRFR